MALARGKYGIEYDPRQMRKNSSGLGWIVTFVVVVAMVSLAWSLVGRFRSAEQQPEEPPAAEPPQEETVRPPTAAKAEPAPEPPPPAPVPPEAISRRPAKVRNLLMRLEEAERARDIEMAASTIETLRALPGSPAADLDNVLARRLGTLNMRRLFDRHNAQWVKTVVIKRGDSASRIASENGSTLASFARLNGGNVDRLVVGRAMTVLNHPRFGLVIHRRSRTADLSLNGKFFKRYDLTGEVSGQEGAFELPSRARAFWAERGIQFKPADRSEIEMLMPVGAPVLVSEM